MFETISRRLARGRGAGGVLLAAALGALVTQAPSLARAQTPAPPSPAAAPANPCSDLPQVQAQPCSDLPANRKTVIPLHPLNNVLEDGQEGHVYPDTALVADGVPSYTGHVNGALPMGMGVTATGVLFGTPKTSGVFPFWLIIRDSANPPSELHLAFELHVAPLSQRVIHPPSKKPMPTPVVVHKPTPPPAPIPTPQGPPPPPPMVAVAPAGSTYIYVLGQSDLAPLAAVSVAPPPSVDAPVAAGARSPVTTVQPQPAPTSCVAPTRLGDLSAMVNVEYPSQTLFEVALQCRYGPGMPDIVRTDALDHARKQEKWVGVAPLHWQSTPGCGCVPAHGKDAKVVYGVFPFWRSKAMGTIDFNRFNRISFLGVQLTSQGGWLRPSAQGDEDLWWASAESFAQTAHAHGAQLDLVLQAGDWGALANTPESEIKTLSEAAARRALVLVDTPLTGFDAFVQRLLAPWWRPQAHVFDGVTLMFQPLPEAHSAAAKNVDEFIDGFMLELVREMQKKGDRYTINIVAPDSLSLVPADNSRPTAAENQITEEQNLFWTRFLIYKKLAEPPSAHPELSGSKRMQYLGWTDISVRLLVPLRESTKITQKTFRANVEKPAAITGEDRVAVLESIIPILFNPAGGEPPGPPKSRALSQAAFQQLDDDMVYFKQNFGGVALWPVPMRGVDAGDDVYGRIKQNFFNNGAIIRGDHAICSTALRLIWQATVVVFVIAAIFYFWVGESSRRGRLYLIGLLAWLIVTIVLSLWLLFSDPALAEASHGNVFLVGLIVLASSLGLWFGFKPTVPQP